MFEIQPINRAAIAAKKEEGILISTMTLSQFDSQNFEDFFINCFIIFYLMKYNPYIRAPKLLPRETLFTHKRYVQWKCYLARE